MAISPTFPKLAKKDYEARVAELRERMIQAQVALKDAPFKVLFIIGGTEGSGRGEVINTLGAWLDPRGVETFSYHAPTDEERARPFMWRFWRSLPTTGRIGIYAGSWYTETLREEARNRKQLALLDDELERIRHFEKLLSDNDTLIVKIWLHLGKSAQRKRLKTLAADPRTAWRVTEEDWRHHRIYDRLQRTANHIRQRTHQPAAPWHAVDAEDERNRNLHIADIFLQSFHLHHARLQRATKTRKPAAPDPSPRALCAAGRKLLQALPLHQSLSFSAYETKRDKWLGRLSTALRAARTANRPLVFAFEGWDAAGKGGAIRRLTSAMDARDYRVIPIAKPTDEEKSHHYLWRFWRHVPADGHIAIYDRSWYGRVLVERLEGFCRQDEWKRAYTEINDFETQLVEHGSIVVKFWLHVSKAEQLHRFQSRAETSYKQHKINDEDWRNRAKWEAYETAVGDMLALTSPPHAPWHLVPADNKRYARLQILKLTCKRIEAALAHPPLTSRITKDRR